LLLLLGFGIALGGAELGLRLLPLGRATPRRAPIVEPAHDPDVLYTLVPGTTAVIEGVQIDISSQGLRDREYPLERPAGVRRIVVIGDSVTFGNGLEVGDTYPEQLEARFAGGERPVEVLNLGVGGYDIRNAVGRLELLGLAFQPDDVVVGFCINDVGIHSFNLQALRWAMEPSWLLRHSKLAQAIVRRLERRAQANQFLELNTEAEFRSRNEGAIDSLDGDPEQRARMAELARQLRLVPASEVFFPVWYTSEAKIGRLRHAFRRLADLSSEHGFRVLVVLVPYLVEAGHSRVYGLVYSIVQHEAERAGFRVLSLHGDFRAHGMRRLGLLKAKVHDPIHPGPEGHRLIAERLHEALSDTP